MNAMAADVLVPGHEYFYVYEKEAIERENILYSEITKYVFFESGDSWVK